jgi:hypothetical protein
LDINDLSLRELQTECARVLSTIEATNNNIWKFNQQAHHDSQRWYKSVVSWYIEQYGDLPSKTGPGKDVKLIYDVQI